MFLQLESLGTKTSKPAHEDPEAGRTISRDTPHSHEQEELLAA